MSIDRRDFLRLSANTSAAAAALAALPLSIQKALAVPAAVDTGTIKDIKHVVMLMQENRGFDHYFGTLKGVRGFGDRFPVPLESGRPVWYQSNGSREIAPFHLDPALFNALLAPSTPHSFSDSQAAWNQGKFGNWPKYKNDNSMGYFKRQDIPFQFALAEAFTICDSYHCSITTGTDPNRVTFWSGSNFNPELRSQGINCTDADAEVNNLRCWIANPALDKWPVPGYTYQGSAFKWPTIPDLLEQAGVSWRIYQDPNDNWTGAMNGCLAFDSFRTAKPGSPIYQNGMSLWTLEDLANDVKNGTLPQVCWVLPPQAFSEHPGGPSSPLKGSNFTEHVLNALTANSTVWSKTAFFLTFDENDGSFDHVPPPAVPSYNLDGTLAGKSTVGLYGEYFSDPNGAYRKADDTISGPLRPYGLSARVPMYVISPWSKGGWVNSQVFDHSSMAMFLEKRFGITVPNVSPWHRAVCGDLTSAFEFRHPADVAVPSLPDTSNYAVIDAQQRALGKYIVPATNQPLFQEAGFRLSRKLPYQLHVDAVVRAGISVELAFLNTGSQGAVFHVYDKLHLDRIPRRYTVEAGKSLSDVWNTSLDRGKHDLWVYGPNSFVRGFKIDAVAADNAAMPEIKVRYMREEGSLTVSFANAGTQACRLTVRDNAYRSGGPKAVTVAPGKVVEHRWSLNKSANWYDFSVIADAPGGYERRFAGRVETGKHSYSDPAIGIV
ncbi:MAG TPA: phospholipase C, phosphocholine-specific [Telluria sp.]|nr:phospholipase C, phosphocholine-specific [Telluria sp.]